MRQAAESKSVPTQEHVASSKQLQRQCACGQHASGGQCSQCKGKRTQVPHRIQRARNADVSSINPPSDWSSSNAESFGLTSLAHLLKARDRGAPLNTPVRESMENNLGMTFSDVLVHSGRPARAAANLLGVRAFTIGKDVYLGDETLRSDVTSNQVLAHELVHTTQQRPWHGAPLQVLPAKSPQERVAESVMRGTNERPQTTVPTGFAQPAQLMALPGWALALIAGELACVFGFFLYALSNLWGKGDKFLHCWTSCKIATWCPPIPLVGQAAAAIIGALKELADIVIGESELRDMQNNMSGIECSFHYLTSCEDCCNDKLSKGLLAMTPSGSEAEGQLASTGPAAETGDSLTGAQAAEYAREQLPSEAEA